MGKLTKLELLTALVDAMTEEHRKADEAAARQASSGSGLCGTGDGRKQPESEVQPGPGAAGASGQPETSGGVDSAEAGPLCASQKSEEAEKNEEMDLRLLADLIWLDPERMDELDDETIKKLKDMGLIEPQTDDDEDYEEE